MANIAQCLIGVWEHILEADPEAARPPPPLPSIKYPMEMI